MKLASVLDIRNLEGHRADLVDLIITANQLLLDNRQWLLAMAYDDKFTSMESYIRYSDKFAIPFILFFIQNDT